MRGVRGSLLRSIDTKRDASTIVDAISAEELGKFPNRNVAEALRGCAVWVSRAEFPAPDDDEFYWVDLIGLEVVNREGAPLGRVTDLLDTGPHCVLRVQAEVHGGEAIERLIPFVSAYIDSVDLAARRIVADWGLDY